jgi:hypothetical protein
VRSNFVPHSHLREVTMKRVYLLGLSILTLSACLAPDPAVTERSSAIGTPSVCTGADGDPCGGSIGICCYAGLSCHGLPTPASGLIGGSGVCGAGEVCDLDTDFACGDDEVCAGTDVKLFGVCKPFDHGQSVGRGYACGGSIGVGCVAGLTCDVPPGIGRVGTCR